MNTQQRINQLVDQLREIGIVVDFTDHPVEFLATREDGCTKVECGLITVSRTGRKYLEIFDVAHHSRRYVLEQVLDDPFRWEDTEYIDLWLCPKYARELREWAEVRDALLAVA